MLGTSLLEFFDETMMNVHIASLRSTDPMKTNMVLLLREVSSSPDVCQACGEGKRTFEPPTLYCHLCGLRIKRNQVSGACVWCMCVGRCLDVHACKAAIATIAHTPPASCQLCHGVPSYESHARCTCHGIQ